MKRVFMILLCVCVLSASALAVDRSNYEYTLPDGSVVFYEDEYNAAVAVEKVESAGLTLSVDLFWYEDDSGLHFDNDAFEAAYVAALEKQSTESVGDTDGTNGSSIEESDDKYPVGSYVDADGNVWSSDGQLLSDGTTPATYPLEDDTVSSDVLDTSDEAETSPDEAAAAVYDVVDLRSADDTSVSADVGLKSIIVSIFGEYTPVMTSAAVTETVDNVTTTTLIDVVADGAAGVDYAWCAGVLLFAVLLYCLMKLLGGVLK